MGCLWLLQFEEDEIIVGNMFIGEVKKKIIIYILE